MTITELNEKIRALEKFQRLSLTDVPADLYHESEGIGSTLLKAATRSMAHYKAALEHTEDKSPAAIKAMAIGSATHCLVLEPEKYPKKFVTQPREIKQRRGTNWDAFSKQHEDKIILTGADEELASAMADAVVTAAGKFFMGGQAEKSYWYRHPNGLILKARVDYQQGDAIIDLKTTQHDSPEQFKKAVKYDYAVQDALYPLVTGLPDIIFVGIGKNKPHPVFLCRQGALVREKARADIDDTLRAIVEATEFDDYPNIPVEMTETEFTPMELEKYCA